MITEQSNICVAGIGAVGGILTGMLGKRYADSLTLIARGARAEALRSRGMVLHSEFYGEITVHPAQVTDTAEGIGVQDYVFVCVKNYSLTQMAELLRPCVGPHTVVIPVMNGVEPGDRLRALLPGAIVCDALIYTVTASNEDFSATQIGPYTYLYVGSKLRDAAHVEAARRVYELLRSVDFDARYSDEIESEIWQKFILNCAFNPVTARHLATSGQIRQDEGMRRDVYGLLSEAYAAGAAEGVQLPQNLVETKYQFMMNRQAENATSSMRRDVEAKRPTELDAFLGAVLRASEKHGLSAPVTERYFRELQAMEAAF